MYSNKFKPGDKVTTKWNDYIPYGVTPGNVYTVKSSASTVMYLEESAVCVRVNAFDLVEDKSDDLKQNNADALDVLIQRANDGMRAITALYNADPTVVAIHDDDTKGVTVGHYSYSDFKEFRRKAPTLPAPFTLKDSGYRVEFDFYDTSKNVKVGCQTYPVREITQAIEALVRNNWSKFSAGGYELYATKQGVFDGQHRITWADAEQLLAALEQVKS